MKNLFSFFRNYVPEDFFIWITFFYKIKGLSPPKKLLPKALYLSVAMPHIFMCTFLLICSEWTAFAFSSQTFKERMFNMSVATLDTILVFRTVVWVFTKDKLDKIKRLISRKCFDFQCFGVVRLGYEHLFRDGKQEKGRSLDFADFGMLWKRADLAFDKQRNAVELFRIERMLQTRLVCCFIHLAITVISISTYMLSFINELSIETYEDFNIHLNKTSEYRKFLYPLFLPFDTSFDGYYWLGYFYNCYAHLGNILTFLPIDTTLTCSLIHLISQTTVLNEALKYIDKGISRDQDLKGIDMIREFRLVKCINELQEIYRAVEMLEELCNIQLMVQYGCATFLLCSICYVIPLVENTMEGICCLMFFAASLGQIFIFSYCCQTLAQELQNVGVSAYDIDWPNYPPKLKSTLNILIRKTQQPANLTAGKIVIIDLLFFIQVVQKSYSFYTLITQTN